MKYHCDIFMPFDEVVYKGDKFRGELRNKVGIVCARVHGSEHTFSVDFGDDNAYVLHDSLLQHWRPANVDEQEKFKQEVYRRRRPKSEDD